LFFILLSLGAQHDAFVAGLAPTSPPSRIFGDTAQVRKIVKNKREDYEKRRRALLLLSVAQDRERGIEHEHDSIKINLDSNLFDPPGGRQPLFTDRRAL